MTACLPILLSTGYCGVEPGRARLRWRPSRRAGGGSSEPLLPRPALMRRGDVVPRLIERVAYSDALPWPAFAGGEAQRVAVAAHQHGDGEIAAFGGAQDRNELSFGGGELHGEASLAIDAIAAVSPRRPW